MDNKCSRAHPLFNQTAVHIGKIILSPKDGPKHCHTKPAFNQFRASKFNSRILKQTENLDKQYYSTLTSTLPTVNDQDDSAPKKKEADKSLFKNSCITRPSRAIMREAYPKLDKTGVLRRQMPEGFQTQTVTPKSLIFKRDTKKNADLASTGSQNTRLTIGEQSGMLTVPSEMKHVPSYGSAHTRIKSLSMTKEKF